MRAALLLTLLSGAVMAQSPLDFIFSDGFENVQAMRMDQLVLRDPHLYTSFIGCQDLTSTINSQITTTLVADDDGDGILDNSLTFVFRPIHVNGRSGLARVGNAQCTAPVAGTSCSLGDTPFASLPYDSLAVGTCLQPIPGTTTGSYTPAISPSVGPCIAAQSNAIELDIGIPLPLSDLHIGASRRENPTPGLHNGLLYGFLTEAAANLITIELPLVGSRTLASLLPGGAGNCAAHSDLDTHDGQSGWWFYFNYSASEVPFTE